MSIFDTWQGIVVYTVVVFLTGAAVPVILLRTAAADREDSCFLGIVLAGLGFLALLAIGALIYFAAI